MYRNISAEFQTVNDADYVAQKIRQTTQGVKRISFNFKNKEIKVKKNSGAFLDFMGTYNMGITGTFLPHDYEYYGTKNIKDFTSVGDALEKDYAQRIEGNKGTVLNVVCHESQLKDVEKKLIAYGGLNISK